MKAATISDVARRANVHKSTVSRVLNGGQNVSEETKTKIARVMAELNFTPSSTARSLATGFKRVFGLVYSEQSMGEVAQNPFFPTVVKGISNFLADKNYNILLLTSPGSYSNTIADVVNGRALDGLIINSSSGDEKLYRALHDSGIPHVSIGDPGVAGNHFFVEYDDTNASYIAAKHLIDRGYRSLRLVVSRPHGKLLLHNQRRISGFRRALSDGGMPLEGRSVVEIPIEMGAIESFARDGVARGDALLVSNEVVAMSLLNSLVGRNRYSVPDDVALLAFGDRSFYRFLQPQLTVVHQDVEWIGSMAAEMLWNQIHGMDGTPQKIVREAVIVQGATT